MVPSRSNMGGEDTLQKHQLLFLAFQKTQALGTQIFISLVHSEGGGGREEQAVRGGRNELLGSGVQ